MLLVFSAGLRLIQWQQVIPFEEEDFILMLDDKFGVHYSNIMLDDGQRFDMKMIVQTNETVFHCSDFMKKCDEFVDIFPTRLERYFRTMKSPYLFFDLEEQKYLQSVFDKLSFSADVEVVKYGLNGFERVNLLHMPYSLAMRTVSQLDALKVRDYYTVREGYNMKCSVSKDADIKMDTLLGIADYKKRYPNLYRLRSKKDFALYRRNLLRKYHPDVSSIKNADALCAMISDDMDKLEQSIWYKRMPDEIKGGKPSGGTITAVH